MHLFQCYEKCNPRLFTAEAISQLLDGLVSSITIYFTAYRPLRQCKEVHRIQNDPKSHSTGLLYDLRSGPMLCNFRKVPTKLLIIDGYARLVASRIGRVILVDSLAAQHFGYFLERTVFLAAEEQDAGAVADDRLGVVLIKRL